MNLSMQCCCDIELGDCSDACECATSYTINALQGQYSYQFELDYGSAWDCSVCPSQQGCSATWWSISVAWALTAPMVVTRSADPSGVGCIYSGTGTVHVQGSVDYTYKWQCNDLPGCPAFESTQTWTFDTETCVCVTVRCEASPTGSNPGCNDSVPGAAWRHTVEIGDFVVACDAELWSDSGCDPVCPVQGPPVGLRCQGGAVDYLTPLACLDTLMPADWICAGWRNGPVSSYCFASVGAAAPRGPFGVQVEGECSPGQDDYPCLDAGQASTGVTLFHTNHFAPTTPGLCGDWSISQLVCNGTVRLDAAQTGCTPVGAPITYA